MADVRLLRTRIGQTLNGRQVTGKPKVEISQNQLTVGAQDSNNAQFSERQRLRAK